MKKLLPFIFILSALFWGCSSDSGSDSESNLAQQGNNETQSSETESKFTYSDISSYSYSFSTRQDLSMENGCVKISQPTYSTSVSNWVLGYNYTTFCGSGFEADLKLNENMNYVAIRLNKTGSYDDILFKVYSSGIFEITQTGKSTLLKLTAADSKIDTAKFNRIKARTCDSGNVEVYVNGNLVKNFAPSDLAFTLVNTDKFGIAYNVKKSTSKDSPALAWVKTYKLQKAK